MGTEGPRWWPQLGSPAHHLTSPPTTFCLCFLPPDLLSSFFFSVYMGLTCSSSLSLWKSNPGSKEIQSIEVRIRIKEQDSNSALAGLYGHSSVRCSLFSHVRLFETLWIVALQAPLSIEFSRQEYYSGLPCPPPGIEPLLLYVFSTGRWVLYH